MKGDPAAITDVQKISQVKSYPNPSNDYINLDWSGFAGTVKRISLMNAAGAIVFDKTVPGLKQYRIPVANYTDGIYYLQLKTDKGVITQKAVIAK